MVYSRGANFSRVVDGRYDIVGFDPRGINWTTPSFECATKEVQRTLLPYTPSALSYHDDEQSYGQTLAFSKLQGLACSQVDSGKYISTALVATDMLYISEALGDERLNYWGFSYGSILGNTFAQLYPESVGRMIVDGVCDAEDYYDGKWLANLINTDDVTQGFFDGCAASTRCALNNGLTSDEIKDNFFGFMEKLKKEPVVVFGDNATGIIDYSSFKASFFSAMYSPTTWEKFAIKANDLMKGNGTAFLNAYSSSNDEVFETGGYATRCGDSSNSTYPSSIDSIAALRDRVSDLQKTTNLWSDFWLLMCDEYTTKPVFSLDRPFERVDATMLLIGNTYDPVTPLQAARKMSQFYTNGIVLHQDGYGHCSVAQKSSCTEKVVRDWFVNGVLPQNNTICSVDEKLFEHEVVIESVIQPFFFGI
jgi:pimeloyl-ACP methyl ester carboxylesterase